MPGAGSREGYAPSIGLIALIDDVVSLTRFAAASFDGDAIPRSLTVVVRTHEDARAKTSVGERSVKLYSAPLSLFARKVEIALREKGLAFERVMVPFSQERGYAPKHPDVLAANPKGQVPVLVDGDLSLFDSTVILEYLEDAYPDPPLFPASPPARARCRMLELFADEVLLPDLRRLMYRSEPPAGDPERRAAREADGRVGEAALRLRWAELESRLGGGEWFAELFSAADIALFMMVLFVQRLHGPGFDGFPFLPRGSPGPRSGRRWHRPYTRLPPPISLCRRHSRHGAQARGGAAPPTSPRSPPPHPPSPRRWSG